VKNNNLYVPRQNGKLLRWLGVALGGIFATIAVGSGFLIVRLTRSANAAPPASLATAPPPAAAPVATPTPAVAAPDPAKGTATPAQVPPPQLADSKHHSQHHDHGKHVAAAQAKKSAPAASASEPNSTAAGHASASKPHEKDALDKLLGM
jgi:hypothetical protein